MKLNWRLLKYGNLIETLIQFDDQIDHQDNYLYNNNLYNTIKLLSYDK